MDNDVPLVGETCPQCGFEMMEISRENLQKCMGMKPEFRSIPKHLLKMNLAFTPICPQCDAYALGLDMTEGIPFKDKSGNIITVHDLN